VSEQRISLIIPAYNEECYLARCLDSVATQVVQPFEVIVVDNNSVDRTADVARKYPFVKLVHEERQGRAFAQSAGFDAATGEILARIDADAVLPPDWTEHIADYFKQPQALKSAWTGGALFYNVRFARLASRIYGWIGFSLNRFFAGHASLWGSSMALPKQAWQAVAPTMCMRSDLHEDLDLSIHLHEQGYTIVPDPHTMVGVELRPAYAGPRKVWTYLQLWPRTLRVHDKWTWPLCWPINLVVFVGMPFFGISERLARLVGRRPLND
jgi:glycosyltransferase involved in cell wall biosynthesis